MLNQFAAYGWVKCEREEDRDCAAVLLNASIISRTGVIFETGSRYTRLSLIKTEDDMDLLLRRFESLVSQEEPALNVASASSSTRWCDNYQLSRLIHPSITAAHIYIHYISRSRMYMLIEWYNLQFEWALLNIYIYILHWGKLHV